MTPFVMKVANKARELLQEMNPKDQASQMAAAERILWEGGLLPARLTKLASDPETFVRRAIEDNGQIANQQHNLNRSPIWAAESLEALAQALVPARDRD